METRNIFENLSCLDHRYSLSEKEVFNKLSQYISEEASVRSCAKAEAALDPYTGPVTEEARNLTQKRRYCGAIALSQPPAHIIGHEKALDVERILVFRPAVWSITSSHGKCRIDGHIPEFIAPVCQSLRKHFRD